MISQCIKITYYTSNPLFKKYKLANCCVKIISDYESIIYESKHTLYNLYISSASPKLLNLNQDHPSKKWFF